jgi:hypothetical protein
MAFVQCQGRRFSAEQFYGVAVVNAILTTQEATMGRGILLWLLGVPIPVILLLWFFMR